MGAQLYFSLPFRLGLSKEWLIPLNALTLCVSAVMAVPALAALLPNTTRTQRVVLGAASLAVHLLFLGGIVQNTLSDLPAAAAALTAIWVMILATVRERRGFYAAAGGALGLSAVIRVFNLYPALACGACVLIATAWRKRTWVHGGLFLVAFAVPVLLQIYFTHAVTGAWAFIEPKSSAYGQSLHFETISYGYETILPWRGLRYDAPQCFADAFGMGDAIRKHVWGEALCLVKWRQWFYFGSYTKGGMVYLPAADDRVFSIWFLLANATAVLGAAAWFLRLTRQRPTLLPIVVFLGAMWGEAAAIIPEGRFIVAFQIAAWVLAAAGLAEVALRARWTVRLPWTAKGDEARANGP